MCHAVTTIPLLVASDHLEEIRQGRRGEEFNLLFSIGLDPPATTTTKLFYTKDYHRLNIWKLEINQDHNEVDTLNCIWSQPQKNKDGTELAVLIIIILQMYSAGLEELYLEIL